MKKTIFSVAAIAATFMAFAFSPVEKNNDMDNIFITNAEKEVGCDEFSRTYREATECWTSSTLEPELQAAQREVLNSY